jgi:hypothetical protein
MLGHELDIRAHPVTPECGMKIFICGIIQGSHSELAIHGQSYRSRIRDLLKEYLPAAEVYCPGSLHPQSLSYEDARAFQVFAESIDAAAGSDLLIAYLPEASLGSAIEMWEAKKAGAKIVTITPLRHNWVVRYASDMIVDDLGQFEELLKDGTIAGLL